jgi:hypothetical protein
VVWVNPGNEGAADVTAGAVVDVYAVVSGSRTLIATTPITEVLTAGRFADSLQIDITGMAPETFQALIVEIRSSDLECDADNNEIRFEGPFCN